MDAQFIDNISLSGRVCGGYCWDALTKERMKNPKALESYGYKVYSQNDEDGIIHEIFRRIGSTTKTFVEFGVQDGLESNCHLLLHYGWKGLWIEGDETFCEQIKSKFRPVIEKGQLKIENAFITKDNINELIQSQEIKGEIDLLSIDIDGNDYYVWNAIKVVNPRVVIIEYNGKFPPDLEWIQAYDPSHVWDTSDWHGASLKALEKLGAKLGYQLVGTELRGCNAFFVKVDLVGDSFYEEATAEALYNPLRLELVFTANHPSKYCLVGQKENLGLLNYENFVLHQGFHELETDGKRKHAWTSEEESKFELVIKKNTKKIRIPYWIPKVVLENHGECILEVTIKELRVHFEQVIKEERGHIELSILDVISEDRKYYIEVNWAMLWCPLEYGISSDIRSLGIDFIFSELVES